MEESWIEIIDRYLRDELEGSALNDFEERLAQDKELQSAVERMQNLQEAAKRSNAERKLEMLRNYGAAQQRKRGQQRNLIFTLSAAAAVILAVVVALPILRPSTDPIFAEHFEVPVIPQLSRSSGASLSELQRRAYSALASNDFREAAPLLEQLIEMELDTASLLLGAVAQLGLGHTDQAKDLLDRYAGKNSRAEPDIVFYRALLAVHQQEYSTAIELIDQAYPSDLRKPRKLQRLYDDLINQPE